MSSNSVNDVGPRSDHSTGSVSEPVNAEVSLADLVGRLDVLVESYSGEDAKPDSSVESAGAQDTDAPSAPSSTTKQGENTLPAEGHTFSDMPGESTFKNRSRRALPDGIKAAKILIVDDEEATILTVEHYLKGEGYQNFMSSTNPREVIELLRQQTPDVVLLDIRMPEVSGLDILRVKELDSSLEHIPVIVLTATTDPVTKRRALDLGATDFLPKPVDPNDLAPRVRNALVVKKHYDQMADQAARLEGLVRHRTAELVQSRQQVILSLARAAEHRDSDTGNHVLRVGRFAGVIACELGWSQSQAEMIEQAAPLHDVGKIGVPDNILFKPGKLDPQEFEIIRKHCAWGKQIIEPYSGREMEMIQSHARQGESILHVRASAMLMMASRIAQTHHERWDGTGYPLGLAGEDIPLEGRITAVADVFDALSSKRPYKEPFARERCFEILQENRGTYFDPRVLDAFFARAEDIIAIQLELMDLCPVDNSRP